MERFRAVPRILSVCNNRGGRRLTDHDLEDLSQDVVVLLWKKLSQFQGLSTLEGWFYRFCALEYRNRLRREGYRAWSKVGGEPPEVPVPSPEDAWIDRQLLQASLTELGPPEEDIVRLKHYQGLTFTEIGEQLGESSNTIKTRYYRGIRWLRQHLAPHVGEDAAS